MKRFVFRESKLLALRKQQVVIAELAVAKTTDQVMVASKAVDRIQEDIEELSSRILEDGRNGLVHLSQTAFALRTKLEQATHRLNARKEDRFAAVESLQQANVATESLLALRSAKMEKYEADRRKHVQAELDFNATRKWMTEERHPDV